MDTTDSLEADSPEPAEEATDGRDRKLQLLLTVNRELDKARAEAQAEEQDEDDEEEAEDEAPEDEELDSQCGMRNRVVGRFQRPVRWCVMRADSTSRCLVIMINWSDFRPKHAPQPEDAAS